MRKRAFRQLHASMYISYFDTPIKKRSRIVGKKSGSTFKVGRDARTGKFIPVKTAQKRKSTAVVETMKRRKK